MPAPDAPAPVPAVFTEFCGAGLWTGVGRATAEQLVTAGIDGPAAVTVESLAQLPRVTDKRARRLYHAFLDAQDAYRVVELLVPPGLPARWAGRLVTILGAAADEILAADPWRVLVLPEVSVDEADRLARAATPGFAAHDPRRARALVDWALARMARDGHTCAPMALVTDAIRPYGIGRPPDAAAAVSSAVAAGLVSEIDDPTGAGEEWVARAPLAAAEHAIARHLSRIEHAARPLVSDAAARRAAHRLDEVQTSAVVRAAHHGVSLLTGGPGTGKSRTVTAVVAMCRRAGLSLALAAPTGRAAKRLAELLAEAAAEQVPGEPAADGDTPDDAAVDGDAPDDAAADGDAPDAGDEHDAMTIHRLLGARPGPGGIGSTFERDADLPVDADMVVVDEASMLDTELAAALLAAVADGSHLVIVGDPAQLPSIGAGRVLGDLIDAGRYPRTELTRLYRQTEGGAIARLATSVRGGALTPADPDQREVVIVPASGSDEAARRVVQLVTDSIPRVFGLRGDEIQVVTPIHRGSAGTWALNAALKTARNPGPHPARSTVRGFDVGDRVVATANHPEAEPVGYANGEVGTVIETTGKALLVAFPGGDAEISGKALGDLLHGWAITVHRAQGSEWEAVVVVLPPEAGRMLSRPLVYTALTRARRHLSVVHAAGPLVARAVARIGARPRRTRLTWLLGNFRGEIVEQASGGAQP